MVSLLYLKILTMSLSPPTSLTASVQQSIISFNASVQISAWNHTYGLNIKVVNYMDSTVVRCATDWIFLYWPDPLRFLDEIRKWKPGGSAYGPTARQTWYPHRSTRISVAFAGIYLYQSVRIPLTSGRRRILWMFRLRGRLHGVWKLGHTSRLVCPVRQLWKWRDGMFCPGGSLPLWKFRWVLHWRLLLRRKTVACGPEW